MLPEVTTQFSDETDEIVRTKFGGGVKEKAEVLFRQGLGNEILCSFAAQL